MGLTYKPGTNTLRRSSSVELCDWLIANGANVRVHDPVVKVLPSNWTNIVTNYDDPLDLLSGAKALVIATEWTQYKEISISKIPEVAPGLMVLDANSFVQGLSDLETIEYNAVGIKGGL